MSHRRDTSTQVGPDVAASTVVRSAFSKLGLAVGSAVSLLAVWQIMVVAFKLHPIILPPPMKVLATAWAESEPLAMGFLITASAALLGLAFSLLIGVATAIVFSQSQILRKLFYPYVVFLQTVPIVAIAPLLITWFGYGFRTVVLVSSIISLFPIISNVTAGLISIDENLRDYFRLCGASAWQTLIKLRIPHAVSNLVLALRISAGLAVIGAIVGEFFVDNGASGRVGLGTLMTGWQIAARTDAVIAAILASTLLGILILAAVNLVANVCLKRWTVSDSFENE